MYGVIPSLERQIPKETDEKQLGTTTLLHEAVTEEDVAQVVAR